jgi:hypothetical protein
MRDEHGYEKSGAVIKAGENTIEISRETFEALKKGYEDRPQGVYTPFWFPSERNRLPGCTEETPLNLDMFSGASPSVKRIKI